MRLKQYLMEEDVIQKGLSIEEPEVDEEYTDEQIKYNISILKKAIKEQKLNGIKSKSDNAILADLEDKLKKWKNIKKETKPTGPNIPAVDILAAKPPETPEEKKK
jgi:hypothetical protein